MTSGSDATNSIWKPSGNRMDANASSGDFGGGMRTAMSSRAEIRWVRAGCAPVAGVSMSNTPSTTRTVVPTRDGGSSSAPVRRADRTNCDQPLVQPNSTRTLRFQR